MRDRHMRTTNNGIKTKLIDFIDDAIQGNVSADTFSSVSVPRLLRKCQKPHIVMPYSVFFSIKNEMNWLIQTAAQNLFKLINLNCARQIQMPIWIKRICWQSSCFIIMYFFMKTSIFIVNCMWSHHFLYPITTTETNETIDRCYLRFGYKSDGSLVGYICLRMYEHSTLSKSIVLIWFCPYMHLNNLQFNLRKNVHETFTNYDRS